MDAAEIAGALADHGADRGRSGAGGGRAAPLEADDLAAALARDARLRPIRDAGRRAGGWMDGARRAVAISIAADAAAVRDRARSPRGDVVDRIRARFPDCREATPPPAATESSQATSTCSATADSDSYSRRAGTGGSRSRLASRPGPRAGEPPVRFWSAVPYLEPECGDHKIIWELNRHQHWLALGRAYWLTGTGAIATAVVARARELDGRQPAARRHQLGEHAGARRSDRSRGSGRLTSSPAIRTTTAPWLVDLVVALDRQLAQIESNLSYYFSPNTHLLGEALALYVCGRALPGWRPPRGTNASGRTVLLARFDGRSPATAATASDPRTTTGTRSTSICSRSTIARITGDPAAARVRRRGRLAWDSPPACWPTTAAGCRTSETTMADRRGRWPAGAVDDMRDSLAVASVLTATARSPDRSDAGRGMWLLGPSAAAGRADDRIEPHRAEPIGSAALAETRLLRVAHPPTAIIWWSTRGLTATERRATPTPMRCR